MRIVVLCEFGLKMHIHILVRGFGGKSEENGNLCNLIFLGKH